jgi:hypothetical protein
MLVIPLQTFGIDMVRFKNLFTFAFFTSIFFNLNFCPALFFNTLLNLKVMYSYFLLNSMIFVTSIMKMGFCGGLDFEMSFKIKNLLQMLRSVQFRLFISVLFL